MIKSGGHHMMHISQWLKFGGGQITVTFWNANILLVKGKTHKMGLMGTLETASHK
jgi:hypothetical protein